MRAALAILLLVAQAALAEDVRFIVLHNATPLVAYRLEVWPFPKPECPTCKRFSVVKVFLTCDPGYTCYNIVKDDVTATAATTLVNALELGVLADDYAEK